MPADHHDTRTSERIEAFLEGPPRPARKRARVGMRRPHPPIVLETAAEWRAALARETVRVRRYGRPATVMIVEVTVNPLTGPDEAATAFDLVEPVLDAIRHETRETDRVTRMSATRFHLLLPETAETDAAHFAERLRGACRDRLNGHGGTLRLRVESATPGHGGSLADALGDVERRLDD
jgi:hypothetical protein